jgi:hypothetical protein
MATEVGRPIVPRVVHLQRRLTETPLARQHEHALAQRSAPRRHAPIAWDRFDRSAYPEPALALAANANRALAGGEYGAIDVFARLASALALNGAPFDLVAVAARIPGDEIRHADYAVRLASLCEGRDVTFSIDRNNFETRWERAIDLEELDDLMVEIPTIGETLAGAFLTACQRRAVDPVAKAVFSAIVSDEVHHARLGWYYLVWRAPQWSTAQRQRVANRAGALIAGTEALYWRGRDAPASAAAAAAALGVLDTPTQQDVLNRVMDEEILPGLDALGLGASHAWRGRSRLAGAT